MSGFVSLVHGVAVDVFFLCTFPYAIGFTGNVFVPPAVERSTYVLAAEN